MDWPTVDPLRIYFLAGLLFHKAYWEIMKRGSVPAPRPAALPLAVRLIKGVKVAILAGVLVQTIVPWDVFPLAERSAGLRTAAALLFTAGLAIAVAGRAQLGRSWADVETPDAVAKPSLIDRGLYGYIRHPIYTGDIFLLLGLELGLNSWLILLVIFMIPAILRQAVREERTLISKLAGYEEYCRRTKRFVPFVA